MRATSICALVCFVVTGCGGETAGPSGDASIDATPIDASIAVVCSATLIAPCDTATLASSASCPETEPVAGTDCALTPGQDCYYCAGSEGSWAMQLQRPAAYCEEGKWVVTVVACGAAP